MPNENEEQNVAGFRQKVCMYLMTSICICTLASTKMQEFVFNGTYCMYSIVQRLCMPTEQPDNMQVSLLLVYCFQILTLLHTR